MFRNRVKEADEHFVGGCPQHAMYVRRTNRAITESKQLVKERLTVPHRSCSAASDQFQRVVVDLNTVAPARFQIRVSDTGVGIAPEERARIFEPFTQARSGRHRSSAGTGLGLSISHRLVGLMGGTIELDSTEGRGSTFTVVLPLQRDTPGEAS